MRTLTSFWLVNVLLCCSGCSESGPERATVSGTVLLDGKPLVKGSINFIPIHGTEGPTAGTTIEDGRYQIGRTKGVTVGENLVRISFVQPTGRKIQVAGELIDQWAEVLPAEYNSQSTLVRSVKSGANVLDFDLKSRPSGK